MQRMATVPLVGWQGWLVVVVVVVGCGGGGGGGGLGCVFEVCPQVGGTARLLLGPCQGAILDEMLRDDPRGRMDSVDRTDQPALAQDDRGSPPQYVPKRGLWACLTWNDLTTSASQAVSMAKMERPVNRKKSGTTPKTRQAGVGHFL